MLFAVQRRRVALKVEAWVFVAGVLQATLAIDVHHALIRVLAAVNSPSVALEIEAWCLSARTMRATRHSYCRF